ALLPPPDRGPRGRSRPRPPPAAGSPAAWCAGRSWPGLARPPWSWARPGRASYSRKRPGRARRPDANEPASAVGHAELGLQDAMEVASTERDEQGVSLTRGAAHG